MDKKCRACRDNMAEFAYGEITGADADAVKNHIDGCAECAGLYKSYEAGKAAAETVKVDFPEAVWQDHLNGINAGLNEKQPGFFEKAAAFLAPAFELKKAGVALLLLLAVGTVSQVYKYRQGAVMEKKIVENMDMFENIISLSV